jgi:hypothetical protein
MAILRDVSGVKVEVFVGGTPIPEFNDGMQDSPKISTKWVEAVTGANFAVKMSFTERYRSRHGVRAQVSLDGKVMCSSIYRAKHLLYVRLKVTRLRVRGLELTDPISSRSSSSPNSQLVSHWVRKSYSAC